MNPKIRLLGSAIAKADSITLVSHVAPDGDTVGAACALALGFNRLKKKTVLYCSDRIPERLRFLPMAEEFTQSLEKASETECVFCVDVAAPDRIGQGTPLLEQGKPVLVLDHHATNKGYGTLCCVSQCSSVSEAVFQLLEALGISADREIADCLYTGMVTDTGRFSYPETTGDSLRRAAECLDAGADFAGICRTQFQLRRESATRLLGKALSSLELYEDGKIAIMSLTPEDMAACGARMEDVEGIVNYADEVIGVKAGALLYPSNGRWKVSLRASGTARVDKLAAALGGGGHALAAGGHMEGSLTEVREKLHSMMTELCGIR